MNLENKCSDEVVSLSFSSGWIEYKVKVDFFRILQKVAELFFEDEKMVLMLKTFFSRLDVFFFLISFIFFGLGGFRRDSIDVKAIAAKEDADAHFTFEAEAFSLSGRLGELKHDTFDSLFKGGKIKISLGA